MKRARRALAGAICAWLGLAASALAQTPPTSTDPASAADRLRVILTCDTCDREYLKTDVGFVEYLTDGANADVEVTATSAAGSDGGRRYTLKFAGRGRFAGQDRTINAATAASATADDTRREFARAFKAGLADYAASTSLGPQLDVVWKRRSGSSVATSAAKDPWHYWVFRISASGNRNGERSTSNERYNFSANANRTTEAWKIRVSGFRNVSRNRFIVEEEETAETIRSRRDEWNTDTLIVKSLTGHWSWGSTASVAGSTFSNQSRTVTAMTGVEFDIYPYSESTRRSLTIQYTVGTARYNYRAITIFDKLQETLPRHVLTSSLGLRQPWGQAGASFSFTQVLNSLDKNRVSLFGNLNIRILKSLSFNVYGSFSRIRDQFFLEKGEVTEEEVLLRQRQLATGHSYSTNIGFTYSFGSLSNVTVNPRFGG